MNVPSAKSLQQLTKGPLGVLVAFLIVVVGILTACATFAELTTEQRWVVVLFCVLFPFAAFFTFVFLIIKHGTRLYPPESFTSSDDFFRAQSTSEHELRARVERLEYDIQQTRDGDAPATTSVEVTTPQLEQTKKSDKVKVTSIAEPEADGSQMSFAALERLVVDKLASEFGASAQKWVKVGPPGREQAWDAVLKRDTTLYFVEVVFLRDYRMRRDKVAILRDKVLQTSLYMPNSGTDVRVVYVIVCVVEYLVSGQQDGTVKRLLDAFDNVENQPQVRVYSRSELINSTTGI